MNQLQIKLLQDQINRLDMQKATLIDNIFNAFTVDEIKSLCDIYDELIAKLQFKLVTGIEVNELEIIRP